MIYPNKLMFERAADPLASTMRTGHQCGMLWGTSLAASAEVFHRTNGGSNSIAIAIAVSKFLAESFIKKLC